jgi:hypothetical protein
MLDKSSDNDNEISVFGIMTDNADDNASANNGNTIAEDDIAEIPLLCNRGRSIDDANDDDDDDDDGTGGGQIYTIDELLKLGLQMVQYQSKCMDQEGKKGNKPESIPKAFW